MRRPRGGGGPTLRATGWAAGTSLDGAVNRLGNGVLGARGRFPRRQNSRAGETGRKLAPPGVTRGACARTGGIRDHQRARGECRHLRWQLTRPMDHGSGTRLKPGRRDQPVGQWGGGRRGRAL